MNIFNSSKITVKRSFVNLAKKNGFLLYDCIAEYDGDHNQIITMVGLLYRRCVNVNSVCSQRFLCFYLSDQ